MNVLEKILEELEERVNYRKRLVRYEKKNGTITDVVRNQGALEELVIVEKIIRSHMNEVNDTNVPSNWIPVEERLPEEGKEVLAQFVVRVRHTNGQVDEMVYIYPLHYEEGKWKSFHGMPNGKVEAWQPLPETYKGK